MSATPFMIVAGDNAVHIVNTATHKRLETFSGKTARKRALKALELLRVGYLSREVIGK